MSTEQEQHSPDADLIEQTKQQIRGIVNEIAQLSKSDLSVEEYYEAFLNKVVSALAATGGAVWAVGESGRLQLEYQMNLRSTGLADDPEGQVRHGKLLRKIMESGEGALVPPQSGAGDSDELSNPTDFLLVLGPLKSDKEVQGVVEIFQRPTNLPRTQRGYLRFVMQMCELAGDFLKTRRLRHYMDRQTLWTRLENFTRSAHQSLDPRVAAYTIANEGRRLIECDRVSVAIAKGRKCTVEAVSGQDTFDKRSNTITLLNHLASAVAATGEAVWYTGDTTDMPPQVEEAVQDYVDESHTKAVAILPLKRIQPEEAEEKDEKQPEEIIGALVIEQIEDARIREGMMQRVDVVAEHSAAALSNALEHNNLFLMPLWRQLGKAAWVVRARTLPKTLTIVGLVLAALIALVVVPANFELEADGTLEAVERQRVYARIDGVVENIPANIKDGAEVGEGELLVKLRSSELDRKISEIVGKIEANSQAAMAARQKAGIPGIPQAERLSAMGESQTLEADLVALQEQLEEYRRQQEYLTVTSPIKGRVVTWQVSEELRRRPVSRGEKLMEIADPSGDLELELLMPEDRMGHVLGASLDSDEPLTVSYILATHPSLTFEGTVKEIKTTAEVQGTEGNTVKIVVSIDKADLPENPQLGGSVTAKVHAGRRPVGYVWFHDLIAFMQRLWFRLT